MDLSEEVLITAADGVELAADIRLPQTAVPVPAVVSVYPYRKDDISGAFNQYWRTRLAASGYATLLADSRGTGASGGSPAAAATAIQEGRDGCELVEWVAAQEWCSGDVGLWGISYGAAVALAAGAQRPHHLRAIASMYGYADSYSDSVMPGGRLAALGRFAREAFMLALALAPPARRDTAGRWRQVWHDRLAGLASSGPESLRWLDHRDFDDYWRALQVDVSRIDVPTFLVAGWRDLYPQAMSDVYRRLPGQKRMLAGPWLHVAPELADVEPVDWLDMLIEFFDVWLKAEPASGSRSSLGPPVTYYVQRGRWRQSDDWPPPEAEALMLHLGDGGELLESRDGDSCGTEYTADRTVGTAAGLLDPLGVGLGVPVDQGPDEARSVCYTTPPLDADMEIVGSPRLRVSITIDDADDIMLSAKLSEVSADGGSRLITRGWLDLEHDPNGSGASGQAVGQRRSLQVDLAATAYRVAAGHRLRLAIACADFPATWPATEARIRVHQHDSELLLAFVGPGESPSRYTPPRPADSLDERSPWNVDGQPYWRVDRDPASDAVSVSYGAWSDLALPGGTAFTLRHDARASITEDPREAARIDARGEIEITPGGAPAVTVAATCRHTVDSAAYEGTVKVGGETVFVHRWTSD